MRKVDNDNNNNIYTNDTNIFLKILDREIENTYSIDEFRDIIKVMVIVYRWRVAGIDDKAIMDHIRKLLLPS